MTARPCVPGRELDPAWGEVSMMLIDSRRYINLFLALGVF